MDKTQNSGFQHLGYDVNKLKLIGQGYEGKVYLLPNDKVLKVFYDFRACKRQLEVLLIAKGSRFFPAVFDFDDSSIIMSFVHGDKLSYYLEKNHIDKPLSLELVRLIEELKKLGFTKLDVRIGHIFIQPDGTVIAIDPRKCFEETLTYPKSMLRGLRKYGALRIFLENIKQEYPEYYDYWIKNTYKHKH